MPSLSFSAISLVSLLMDEKQPANILRPDLNHVGIKTHYVSSPPAPTLALTPVYILYNAFAMFPFNPFLYNMFHNLSLLTQLLCRKLYENQQRPHKVSYAATVVFDLKIVLNTKCYCWGKK